MARRYCLITVEGEALLIRSNAGRRWRAQLYRTAPAEARCWRVPRAYEAEVRALAQQVNRAELTEGRLTTDLHSGQCWEQLELFDDDPTTLKERPDVPLP